MQQKFTRSQDAFVLAENTYKASVEKYNKAQEEYNEDMTNSCKVIVVLFYNIFRYIFAK